MVVAFKQFFCSKKTKTKQQQQQQQQKTGQYILILFLYMNFFKILLFLNFKFFFSNYFNKLINILSMFSFLFNTFINLYLGLVVSYIRGERLESPIKLQYYSIMMRVYVCKQLQVQISPRFYYYTQTLWHKQF